MLETIFLLLFSIVSVHAIALEQDFADARRGFIAPLPNNGVIKNGQGSIVWDLPRYDFIKNQQESPKTINPSLWRQAQLLSHAGLFKVVESIYQVRGADISNMTIIEAKKSIIIVDPLLSIETAQAALELYYQHRPKKPISAVIYTHSHLDHFGGIKGILSQQEVTAGNIKIIAPEGFIQAALNENVMVGNAMARRASYMYGNLLPIGPTGQVSCGLGLISSSGTPSLLLPTEYITKTGQEKVIDGVRFVFLLAPDSEAPAEMLFYLPQFKALCAAEDAVHTMHNVYSLRGAKVRDARAWARYLSQALQLWGSSAQVVFAQHHWPVWGNHAVQDFLAKQSDMYQYLHDQTLRLANQGYTMLEIAEKIELPPSLAHEWYNRGYYGSVNHNVKAIYSFYLGWFDGNPSTLHQLPSTEASKKYVEYMGGSDKIIQKALRDFEAREYRWVAQVLNHVVFAEPDNKQAKSLLAKTLEQLGYQTENATWRNFYLSGAHELRAGIKKLPAPSTISPDLIDAMPTTSILEYLAIRLNGPRAAHLPLDFDLIFPDVRENYHIAITNGVLHHAKTSKKAKTQITLKRSDLTRLILNKNELEKLQQTQKIRISGNAKILEQFLSLLDDFEFWFPLVEPKRTVSF